MKKKHSRSIVV